MDAALIGAGATLLDSGISQLSSSFESKQQFKRQKELMKLSNEMNIANWHLQNDYNTPANQIKRLRDAGLNPDLFYGQGGSSVLGSDVAPSSAGSASIGRGVQTNFGQNTLQGQMLDMNRELVDSQVQKNYADANQTNAYTPWVSKQIQSQLQLNVAQTKVLNETVEKIRSDKELVQVNTSIAKRTDKMEEILFKSNVSARLAELGASEEQSKVIVKEFARMYSAQIQLSLAQSYASYKNADANVMNAQTNRESVGVSRYVAEYEKAYKQASISLQSAISKSNIKANDKRNEVYDLQNQWRKQLNDAGIIGEVFHGLLSIPQGIIGGSF